MMKAEQDIPVAILLGGKGTRLGLEGIPKPMVPFMGRPLIENIVNNLRAQGFTNLVFLTGHLSNVIEDHFGDGSGFGVRIQYSVERTPLGTARATRAAADLLGQEFLLVYGDVAFDIDLSKFLARGRALGGLGLLAVHPNDHPEDSDLVIADAQTHRITHFLNKPHETGLRARNLVNAGLYYLRPGIFQAIPEGDALFDWGRDIFPSAVQDGNALYAYRTAEYLKDIGTKARLSKAEQHFESGFVSARSMRNPQRAIFLDRDGVINREINGVHSAQQFECLPKVAETISEINKSPFLAIGITNQPDLAKGFFTFKDLEDVHIQMDNDLVSKGAYLDDLFFCPHHPEQGFDGEVKSLKRHCECRKPEPGMLLQAQALYNISLSNSFMIGDRMTDLMAGRAAGTKTILVHRNGMAELPDETFDASFTDHVVRDLASAWDIIKQEVVL